MPVSRIIHDGAMMDDRACLVDIFKAALSAVDPYRVVLDQKQAILETYERGRSTSFYVIAFGKAAHGMVRAVTDSMAPMVSGGVAVTKYGHWVPMDCSGPIQVYEAGHPLPDENGQRATAEALKIARDLDERALLLCLISGGGSALLVAPAPGILLTEKQRTTEVLLKSGADIYELNAVRKHLSAVKGGRLAAIASPARVESLILSDVIDDRLDVIASGPTAPDETTYGEALGVIEKYGLVDEIPRKAYDLLVRGAQGRLPETLKEGDPLFERVRITIVGSNRQAIEGAKKRCEAKGLDALVVDNAVRGEAREAGRRLARLALEVLKQRGGSGRGLCMISGGETTVVVRGRGKGGRNMELALAATMEIEGVDNITFLSGGTDGTDGPTDAAGAIADGHSIARGRAKGLDERACLLDNDAYRFLEASGDLFVTGPTGTNVMDIQLILVRAPA